MSDDLRHRYAEAIQAVVYGSEATTTDKRISFVAAHTVLAVRDEELERLRAVQVGQADTIRSYQADIRDRWAPMEAEFTENEGVMRALRRHRDTAEAAIARIRALADVYDHDAQHGPTVQARSWAGQFHEDLMTALNKAGEGDGRG